MRIMSVPSELQPWPYRYPLHNIGVGMEMGCHEHLQVHAEKIKSDRIYLPIYWTNNYYAQQHRMGETGFRAVGQVQRVLDTLDSNEQYVTICQNCEGTYEELPENVTVFGAGGTGDVPLPLVCRAHPKYECPDVCPKDLLASFRGAFNCGGALEKRRVAWRSSYNPLGIGTQIRQKMVQSFAKVLDVHIEQGSAEHYLDTWHFRNLMYRSHYALAPRGYGRTSFRLYEAMQLGCVPVYIYDEPWLPYADVLNWENFCVLCHHDDLPDLPRRLAELPEEWRDRAVTQLKQLVPDYFSLEGVKKQLPRMIEGLDA